MSYAADSADLEDMEDEDEGMEEEDWGYDDDALESDQGMQAVEVMPLHAHAASRKGPAVLEVDVGPSMGFGLPARPGLDAHALLYQPIVDYVRFPHMAQVVDFQMGPQPQQQQGLAYAF